MANPFDEDTSNDYFSSGGGGGYTSGAGGNSGEEEFNFYEKQIEEALQSSLASTQRSRGMLEESEDTGLRTANALLHQREQLENVDKKLDEINSSTVQTQKHLNNIKSIFGGIKNRFSRKASDAPKPDANKAPSKLGDTVGNLSADTSGFFDDSGTGKGNSKYTGPPGPSLPESSRQALSGTRWGEMDREIDNNLDDMSAQLRRLQALGSGLGAEIEEQNSMLENISGKTDKTNVEIKKQDQQMKRILGVKAVKPTPAKTEAK